MTQEEYLNVGTYNAYYEGRKNPNNWLFIGGLNRKRNAIEVEVGEVRGQVQKIEIPNEVFRSLIDQVQEKLKESDKKGDKP